ncbi:hypothetical protein [Halobacillus litoralis]|uniref:hypothetical protein n=1 Tax=Halobacillus litoralis TaxID=45668 RepID=UPI001CFE4EEC|nr:hypothetical protein [Halobacillus litoralis]
MQKDPIQLQQRIIYYRAELDKYKKKVQDYQDNYHYSQLEKLKNENADLKEQIDYSSNQESMLKGELSRRVKGYEEQLARHEELEEKYRNEVKDWQGRCVDLKEQNQDLSRYVQDLERDLGQTQRRFSQSQRDLSMLQGSYAEVKTQLHREIEAKEEQLLQVRSLQEALDETDQRLFQTQKNFSFLQASYLEEQKNRREEEGCKEEALADMAAWRNKYSDLKESYDIEMKDWGKKCSDLKDQVQDLEGGLNELRQRHSLSQKEISQMQIRYTESQKQLKSEIESKEKASERAAKLEEELSAFHERYTNEEKEWQNECSNLSEQNKKLTEQMNNLEGKIEESDRFIAQCLGDFSFLQGNYNNQMQALSKELKSRRAANEKADSFKQKWTEAVEQLERQKKETEATLRHMNEEVQSLKKQISSLEGALSQNQDEQNQLRSELKKVSGEKETVLKENKALNKELSAFQKPPYLEQVGEGEFFSQMEEHMNYIFGDSYHQKESNEGKVAFMKVLEKKLEELTNDIETNQGKEE